MNKGLMKGNDWMYVGIGAAALYLVYKVSNSKTGESLDAAGSTWADIVNPATEYGWGVDFAKWLGFDDEKPAAVKPNWEIKDGKIVKNPNMPAPIVYTAAPTNRSSRIVYAGDMTAAEIADWKKAGWVMSGSSMVAPSLVAEQDAYAQSLFKQMQDKTLPKSKYTGNVITSKIDYSRDSSGNKKTAPKVGVRIPANDPSNAAVNAAWKKIVADKAASKKR